MNITRATVKNFMAIELVEISSDGSAVQFAGDNGQGKTSAMLAIIGALGGKKALASALGLSSDPGDEEIIRRGEEMAEVVVEFGGWVVTWQRERGKSDKVEIRGTDGGSHGRAKLGELIGAIAFDPLELDGMPPAKRRATLLEMAGVDLELIDDERAAAYQRRRDVNRYHKQALAQIGEVIEGAPEEVTDVQVLREELVEVQVQHSQNREQQRDAERLGEHAAVAITRAADVATEISRVAALEERGDSLHLAELANMERRHADELAGLTARHKEDVEELAKTLEGARANHQKLSDAAEKINAEAAVALEEAEKLVDQPTDPIKQAIDAGNESNELHQQALARHHRIRGAADLETRSLKLTEKIGAIDAKKVALLAAAKMPIEGLGVSDDDVTIDGHLWETTNFSRRLRVCVAIAAEMAGELKIAFVRSGGNDLDKKNYVAFVKECKRRGLQPWIERNDPEGAGAIVIEAGLVAS